MAPSASYGVREGGEGDSKARALWDATTLRLPYSVSPSLDIDPLDHPSSPSLSLWGPFGMQVPLEPTKPLAAPLWLFYGLSQRAPLTTCWLPYGHILVTPWSHPGHPLTHPLGHFLASPWLPHPGTLGLEEVAFPLTALPFTEYMLNH